MFKVSKYGVVVVGLMLISTLSNGVAVQAAGGCGSVYINEVSPHSISLSWDISDCDGELVHPYYRICWKETWTAPSICAQNEVTTGSPATEFTVDGLAANTRYKFKVKFKRDHNWDFLDGWRKVGTIKQWTSEEPDFDPIQSNWHTRHEIGVIWGPDDDQSFDFYRVCYKQKDAAPDDLSGACGSPGDPSYPFGNDEVNGYVETTNEYATLSGLECMGTYQLVAFGFKSGTSQPFSFGDTEVQTAGNLGICIAEILEEMFDEMQDVLSGYTAFVEVGVDDPEGVKIWLKKDWVDKALEGNLGHDRLQGMIREAYMEGAAQAYGEKRFIPWDNVVGRHLKEYGINLRENNYAAIEYLVQNHPVGYAVFDDMLPEELTLRNYMRAHAPKLFEMVREYTNRLMSRR